MRVITGCMIVFAVLAGGIRAQETETAPTNHTAQSAAQTLPFSESVRQYLEKNLATIRYIHELLAGITNGKQAHEKLEELKERTSDLWDERPRTEIDEITRDDERMAKKVVKEMKPMIDEARHQVDAEIKRIVKLQFFHYFGFQHAISRLADTLSLDDPLTANKKQLERAQEMVKTRCNEASEELGRIATGGPGLTRETAWVMLDDDCDAVALQYQIIRLLGLPFPKEHEFVKENNGEEIKAAYSVMSFRIKLTENEHATIKMWFDVTKAVQRAAIKETPDEEEENIIGTEQSEPGGDS